MDTWGYEIKPKEETYRAEDAVLSIGGLRIKPALGEDLEIHIGEKKLEKSKDYKPADDRPWDDDEQRDDLEPDPFDFWSYYRLPFDDSFKKD